jgi:hypothetical protein
MVAPTFVDRCRDAVALVFQSEGFEAPHFSASDTGDQEFWVATFRLRGEEHRIEIARDLPMLYVGNRRLECYLPEEFENQDALIKGFAARLRRLLSGGSWGDPAEQGLPDRVRRFWRRILKLATDSQG